MSKLPTNAIMSLVLLTVSYPGEAANAATILCRPLNTTTRILNSPSQNNIHPNWTGDSYIGMSWNLIKYGTVNKGGVQFIKGKLLPPFRPSSGYTYEQYVNGKGDTVWGISREWECK